MRLEARELAPDRNLVSNCSFEAAADGLPLSYEALAGEAAFTLTREHALHGQVALQVSAPASATGPAVLAQSVPGCGRSTYALTAWVRSTAREGGVRLVLEMVGRQQRVLGRQESGPPTGTGEWQQLSVSLRAPQDTELVRLSIVAPPGAAASVDALRLAIVGGPKRGSCGPHVWDLHATRTEATWVMLQWAGPVGKYEVSYREPKWPRRQHTVFGDIRDLWYSVVGLTQETTYEVRVRLQWLAHYDEGGRAVAPPVQPAESEPLVVTTGPWEYREVGTLRVWPFAGLYARGIEGTNPRLEAGKDHLYLAAESGGGVALSKIAPEPQETVWTKQIIPAPAEGPAPVLLDTHFLGETLFVLTQRGPDELALTSLSTEGDEPEPPLVLHPVTAPARLGGASLASLRDELWLQWVEETGTGDEQRGTLQLGVIAGDRLSKTFAWSGAPVRDLSQASAAALGDELLIPFSDLSEEGSPPGHPALDLITFDGLNFGRMRKLRDMGCSRGPRGRQLGPNQYLVFTSDANYLGLAGRYRDVMLATVPQTGLGLEMVNLLDDLKCNLSPDITALGESLWTVHEKLDEAPSAQAPAPRYWGLYLGRIDFGPARVTAPRGPRGEGRRSRPAPDLPPPTP
ncbi:MAG: fibronectin type III domain-containing protein [Armatimonadetes bacterium]|nr:fibronectin type III domain-containing protein [Armatimonadota bacterium]